MDMEQEPNLELTLLHRAALPEAPGFFICTYCDRKFSSSQALGSHQNAHKYERSLAKRRREMAAAMRAHAVAALGSSQDVATRSGATVAIDAETKKARMDEQQDAAAPVRDQQLSNKKMSSELGYDVQRADDLDLSLRLGLLVPLPLSSIFNNLPL